MKVVVAASLLGALAWSTACTWVAVTPGGDRVALRSEADVTGCEKVGSTSAKVLEKVWFVERSKGKVDRELDTLARNEAATLGGDTVVPTSKEIGGKREYAVYDCTD